MKKQWTALLFALLLITPASAQEKKETKPPERISTMVPVKYLEGARLERVVQLMRSFAVNVDGDASMRVIVLSGEAQLVKAAEAAIRTLDVAASPSLPASRNIEVTLHVVHGSTRSGESKLPPGLDPVIRQMKSVFQYQTYRLLDTQIVRIRENTSLRGDAARFSTRVPDPTGSSLYQCNGDLYANVTDDSKGRTYRLDRFRFSCRASNNNIGDFLDLRTDIDVRENQKAVVGKSNIDAESAIFVVVSAKQVE